MLLQSVKINSQVTRRCESIKGAGKLLALLGLLEAVLMESELKINREVERNI